MSEDSSQEDYDGESQNESDGATFNSEDVRKLIEQNNQLVEKIEKLTGNWANEVGSIRKEVAPIRELLSKRQTEEDDDFDPFDRNSLVKLIAQAAAEDRQKWFDNEFMPRLENASRISSLKNEFHLSDEEVGELQAKAEKENRSIRELAFDVFGERKFGDKTNKKSKQLSDELKRNDVGPPLQTTAEADKSFADIPKDPVAYQRWFDKLGPEKAKEALAKAAGIGKA